MQLMAVFEHYTQVTDFYFLPLLVILVLSEAISLFSLLQLEAQPLLWLERSSPWLQAKGCNYDSSLNRSQRIGGSRLRFGRWGFSPGIWRNGHIACPSVDCQSWCRASGLCRKLSRPCTGQSHTRLHMSNTPHRARLSIFCGNHRMSIGRYLAASAVDFRHPTCALVCPSGKTWPSDYWGRLACPCLPSPCRPHIYRIGSTCYTWAPTPFQGWDSSSDCKPHLFQPYLRPSTPDKSTTTLARTVPTIFPTFDASPWIRWWQIGTGNSCQMAA